MSVSVSPEGAQKAAAAVAAAAEEEEEEEEEEEKKKRKKKKKKLLGINTHDYIHCCCWHSHLFHTDLMNQLLDNQRPMQRHHKPMIFSLSSAFPLFNSAAARKTG